MAGKDGRSSDGSYRDLLIWQKGIELTRAVYEMTGDSSFPSDERFGLISQMRRSAASVPANIAEGQARQGNKEFIQFLFIAKGSLAELDTHSIIAHELSYLRHELLQATQAKIQEPQRMIFSLIRTLKTKQ